MGQGSIGCRGRERAGSGWMKPITSYEWPHPQSRALNTTLLTSSDSWRIRGSAVQRVKDTKNWSLTLAVDAAPQARTNSAR